RLSRHASRALRIAAQAPKLRREVLRTPRAEHRRRLAVADELAHAAGERRQHGKAGGEALEERDAEGLLPHRREDQEPAAVVGLRPQTVAWANAREADGVPEALRGDARPELACKAGRIVPVERERDGLALRAEETHGLDGRVHALVLLELAHVDP